MPDHTAPVQHAIRRIRMLLISCTIYFHPAASILSVVVTLYVALDTSAQSMLDRKWAWQAGWAPIWDIYGRGPQGLPAFPAGRTWT